MRLSSNIARVLTGAALAFGFSPTASLADYPERPVTIIVPYAAGGTTDVLARLVADKLTVSLKQSFIVENHGGAAGLTGTAAAGHTAPDGYTLLLGHVGPLVVLPVLKPVPYNTEKDFAPITFLTTVPQVLYVNTAGPKDLKELLASEKAKSGELNHASGGIASPPHIAAELFKRSAHLTAVHVPFKDSVGSVQALLSNQVDFGFDNISVLIPHFQSGKLRPLAIASAKRSPYLPDVPTFAELGYPGVEVDTWFGFLAPAGVPQPILEKIGNATREALKSDEVRTFLKNQGAETRPTTPQEFAAFIGSEKERWAESLKGLTLE